MRHKLLVIDDDLSILKMTCGYFAFCGYEVFQAEDGLRGIEVCREVEPDIILLDLKMRRMNGDEAVPHLRRLVPEARIFMISGYPEALQEACLQGLEVDACFEKPIAIKELQESISAAMQHNDYSAAR